MQSNIRFVCGPGPLVCRRTGRLPRREGQRGAKAGVYLLRRGVGGDERRLSCSRRTRPGGLLRTSQSCRSYCGAKKHRPTEFAPGGPFVADEVQAIVVLWVSWTACTFRAVPHAASDERCAAPRVASGERCAVPHVAPPDRCAAQRAAVHHVSYRTVLERLVLELVLERLALEQLAVPELQRLTSLARWLARQSPTRPVQEGKRRLVGRSFFHSCWRPPR